MLIAEDLLLLLTEDQSGAPSADSTRLTYALAGAMILELSLAGRVDVAGPAESMKQGRLVVRDQSSTGDRTLDSAMAELVRRQNKRPRDVIRYLAKGARADIYGRLVERGAVRRDDSKILGLFPRTRWPVIDTVAKQRSQHDLEQAVVGSANPIDPKTSAVISLLAAIDKLPMVVTPEQTGLTKRQIRRRGKEISADSWAPKAVKDAVAAVNAAVAGAVAGSVAASAATYSS